MLQYRFSGLFGDGPLSTLATMVSDGIIDVSHTLSYAAIGGDGCLEEQVADIRAPSVIGVSEKTAMKRAKTLQFRLRVVRFRVAHDGHRVHVGFAGNDALRRTAAEERGSRALANYRASAEPVTLFTATCTGDNLGDVKLNLWTMMDVSWRLRIYGLCVCTGEAPVLSAAAISLPSVGVCGDCALRQFLTS